MFHLVKIICYRVITRLTVYSSPACLANDGDIETVSMDAAASGGACSMPFPAVNCDAWMGLYWPETLYEKGNGMTDSSLRTVDRALDLLLHVCDDGLHGTSLAECATATELSASTALRVLRSLCARGFISRDDDGLYHPGPQILRLGASVLGRDSLVRLAEPHMKKLVDEINESVYLSVRNYDQSCLYIAIEECSQPIRHVSWVGKTIPLEGSAVGLVLSGGTPDSGFVVERGVVEKDVAAIAAPVRVADGTVAALSVIAPSYRIDDSAGNRIGKALVKQCARFSKELN